MAESSKKLARFEALICDIFSELGDFECVRESGHSRRGPDFMALSSSTGQLLVLEVKVRERITPQIAEDLFAQFESHVSHNPVIRIVYAPVISPRVAEMARRHDVSFVDDAGNCRIASRSTGLLISRSGIPNKASAEKQTTVDPFAPKSSRIVRAILHEPARGWQVTELAEHADVRVSVGLASKIKQALVRESYAVVRDRLLYLKQPGELLAAWTKNYSGPSSERQFYVRGETQEVENRIAGWCEQSRFQYALARLSAAWRLAAEVRYSVASLYVTFDALQTRALESLGLQCGAKEVESGANLVLLTPFDEGVFARRLETPQQTTSPLQTYLDLQTMAGRGTEAAEAIFEQCLRNTFEVSDAEGADRNESN